MVSGPILMDLEGETPDAEERDMLSHPAVGGVILFSRNFSDRDQLVHLIQEIRRMCADKPVLVTVDQEGGRVQRFRDGFTRLPAASTLGDLYEEDARAALRLAELTGWVMARELREVDVDASFAPVVDLDHGISEVIGDRSFHDDPEVVCRLARALVGGMRAGGMAATIKHFPGHGGVAADSHHAVPRDERSLDDLERWDMLPFKRLVESGVAAVMVAHLVFPQVDTLPATLSRYWIRNQLVEALGFRGLVIADDLSMAGAGVISDPGDRARAAVEAGCDIIPICNNRRSVIAALDALGSQDEGSDNSRIRLCGGTPADSPFHASVGWEEARADVAAAAET